jgi:succinate dehydrogenase/fumarate reductase iron-sulfur protein
VELNIQLRIKRTQGWQSYFIQVAESAYVLDALEQAWQQDNSLLFRHSCHHASCGTCGMRINRRERLACATRVAEVMDKKKIIRLEPLRNFPIIGDLVVDTSTLIHSMQEIDFPFLRKSEENIDFSPLVEDASCVYQRFESCIECGLCVSACPIAITCEGFLGPAVLAAADRLVQEPRGREIDLLYESVDHHNGLWRCHQAYECSEVCPMGVGAGEAIGHLRQNLFINAIFNRKR